MSARTLDSLLLPTLFSWYLLLGIASSASKGKCLVSWYMKALYNILISLKNVTSFLCYPVADLSTPIFFLLPPLDSSGKFLYFLGEKKAIGSLMLSTRLWYGRESLFLTMPLSIAVQGLACSNWYMCFEQKQQGKTRS